MIRSVASPAPPAGMGRRALLLGTAARALAVPALSGRYAWAATWPDRPVRIVVPFTPGGSTDILARALAQQLSAVFGQPFVVENRSGAGGTVGTEVVAHAQPDGTTLLMGHIGTLAVNPALYPNLSYGTVTSFRPVVLVAIVPNLLVVNPRRVEATDVAGLVALAKRRPGELTYGSGGNGSAAHIAMVAFAAATGTEMTHIPYRGTAPMMTDLIAGQIDLTMTGGPPALPPVRAGQLRALGVSGLHRLASALEIPTIAGSGHAPNGMPDFEAVQWYGLVAPADTPREVVDRLNAECARILQGPELHARLATEGAEAAPGTPEAFGALIRSERERWRALIRRAGVKPD